MTRAAVATRQSAPRVGSRGAGATERARARSREVDGNHLPRRSSRSMRAREEEARARRANAEVTVLNPLAPSIRTSAPLVPVSSPPTHLGRVVRADEGLLRRRGAVTSTARAAFDGEGASSAAAALADGADGATRRARCASRARIRGR